MSDLEAQLQQDLKAALKGGVSERAGAIRYLISQIQYARIEKGDDLTDQDVLTVLAKQAKSRRESIEAFRAGGRDDLAARETIDLEVVEGYLPEQLGEDEIRSVIREIITEEEISGPADLGRLMKGAMARLKGQADGKVVNRLAGEELERTAD
jgi:uncharacterized protein YqeY